MSRQADTPRPSPAPGQPEPSLWTWCVQVYSAREVSRRCLRLQDTHGQCVPLLLWAILPLAVAWLVSLFGFVVNGPNQARVVLLFGTYAGTVRETGFFYGNPFYWPTRVSLKVRTFETGVSRTEERKDAAGNVTTPASQRRTPLKVNDADGTPIEIAAVVVWRVTDPAAAVSPGADRQTRSSRRSSSSRSRRAERLSSTLARGSSAALAVGGPTE